MSRHFALFVTGMPASGKSTIARELASLLPGFALLEKDVIKEAIFESLSLEERQSPGLSRRLSDQSMHVLWALAPGCPRVILEANFRTRDQAQRDHFWRLDAQKVEVHCHCSTAEAARRFARRAASRHPAHTLQNLSPELLAEFAVPFGLAPVIAVDTNGTPRIRNILDRVRAHWKDL